MASVFMFATVGPAALTFLVRTFVTGRAPQAASCGRRHRSQRRADDAGCTGRRNPGIVAGMIGGDPTLRADAGDDGIRRRFRRGRFRGAAR